MSKVAFYKQIVVGIITTCGLMGTLSGCEQAAAIRITNQAASSCLSAPPGDFSMTLKPGQSKIQNICISPSDWDQFSDSLATRLNLGFLMDTTGSMSGAIDALRTALSGVVTTVSTKVSDATYGLSEYKDNPSDGGDTGDYAYAIVQPLVTDSLLLQTKLNGLVASGGGDTPEAGLEAIYQAATGAGKPAPDPLNPSALGWDPLNPTKHITRLLIVVTDAPFKEASVSREVIKKALIDHQIKVAFIAVGDGADEPTMADFAKASGAIATENSGEIHAGDPLVFHLDANGQALPGSTGDIGKIIVSAVTQTIQFNLSVKVNQRPDEIKIDTGQVLVNLNRGAEACFDVSFESNLVPPSGDGKKSDGCPLVSAVNLSVVTGDGAVLRRTTGSFILPKK